MPWIRTRLSGPSGPATIPNTARPKALLIAATSRANTMLSTVRGPPEKRARAGLVGVNTTAADEKTRHARVAPVVGQVVRRGAANSSRPVTIAKRPVMPSADT